jgi:hypothetical protein
MAAGGITDILVSNEVIAPRKVARLVALAASGEVVLGTHAVHMSSVSGEHSPELSAHLLAVQPRLACCCGWVQASTYQRHGLGWWCSLLAAGVRVRVLYESAEGLQVLADEARKGGLGEAIVGEEGAGSSPPRRLEVMVEVNVGQDRCVLIDAYLVLLPLIP